MTTTMTPKIAQPTGPPIEINVGLPDVGTAPALPATAWPRVRRLRTVCRTTGHRRVAARARLPARAKETARAESFGAAAIANNCARAAERIRVDATRWKRRSLV